MKHPVLDAIRTRRAVRSLLREPLERGELECVLDAGRWAASAGNRRPHRFVAIQDPLTLRLIRAFSPGMFQFPTAAILICIDWRRVASNRVSEQDKTLYIDVGTAAQNMMLASHAIGLGSGPVTSFSHEAVRVVLNLPQHLSPEMFVCLGHPDTSAPQRRKQAKLSWKSITDWERFPDKSQERGT
jgi:nitroreductase